MDYDTKYCNHMWEGFVGNILLNSKLIGSVSKIWGCPSSGTSTLAITFQTGM